ncbi:hypothetical protein NDU88_005388 [Pleurodeles waltl]|uniref:Uncharacterized protein n=1 Tax=Pleurodeles waltl TaxID=8319 RepID=A0AAV7NMA8_PLEWA|nr:hypothetical protein NDU88_005388 [Pleurodeles waltl]
MKVTIYPCDGLARGGQSVNTTCAGAVGSNPDLKDESANPLGLPVSKEQLGRFHAPDNTDKKTDSGEDEHGGRSRSAGEQRLEQRREPVGECPEILAASLAAQEAKITQDG